MITTLRLLGIAGVLSLTAATVIAFMYVKLQAAKRKRQLASKFKQTFFDSAGPSHAATESLGIIYGQSHHKT